MFYIPSYLALQLTRVSNNFNCFIIDVPFTGHYSCYNYSLIKSFGHFTKIPVRNKDQTALSFFPMILKKWYQNVLLKEHTFIAGSH